MNEFRKTRDDFSEEVKVLLARRVNYTCSNPGCRAPTSGPHDDPRKAISVGFACHISAAAMRGPRYDSKITARDRSSPANGIWLCGRCAKLIDGDVLRYSDSALRQWKRNAEAAAQWELETGGMRIARVESHLPIPQIYGLDYHQARRMLIEAGWQPLATWWPHQLPSLRIDVGNGLEFWKLGYHEIKSTCPTHFAFCRFEFRDVHQNTLAIITAGEEWPERGARAGVISWFFAKPE